MESSGLLFIVLMIAVFYFLLIRPQQRRAKQHRDLISAVEVGDEIISVGGIHGIVKRLEEQTLWLEIADNTVIQMARAAISKKLYPEDAEEDESPSQAAQD